MAIRLRSKMAMVALGLGGLGTSNAPNSCLAQGVPRPLSQPALHPLDRAVGATLSDGRPTVVVITSSSSPESHKLLHALHQAPQTRELSRTGQVVSLSMEANAARMRRMGVTSAPMILVYGKGEKGLELAGHLPHPKDSASIIVWLEGLGAIPESTARADSALVRTAHHHHASPQASPQMPQAAPPPPQASPPVYQAAPPAVPQMMAPVMSAPPQAPVMVSAPSAPVVFQPQAATIVVGPQPAPNIVFANAPPSVPNITMMAPSSPTPNMFMAAPSAPPQPMAAPPQPMAAPPQPAMAAGAPMQQQSIAATAAIGLLLNNPGLIDRILGAIGRLLAVRGQPRIQMSPTTPASFSPTLVPAAQAGMFSVPLGQMQSGVPAVPQQLYYVPPGQEATPAQPPVAPSPQGQGVTPSSQSGYGSHGGPVQGHKKRLRLFHWE